MPAIYYIFFIVLLFINNNFALHELNEVTDIVHKEDRAPRPDAPGSQDGSPVGALLECNTEHLNELLKKINAFLINCCSTLQADFNGTFTVLAGQSACSPIFLKAPIVITIPGTYCLAQDVIGTFTIDADNVIFDLNHHTISGSDVGIVINPGTHRIIQNGRIDSMTTAGIMANGCNDLTLQNILCTNCGAKPRFDNGGIVLLNENSTIIMDTIVTDSCSIGISCDGGTNQMIIDCVLSNLLLNNPSFIGLYANNAQNLTISKSTIAGGSLAALLVEAITGLHLNELSLGPSNNGGLTLFFCDDIIMNNIDINNIISTAYNILVANNVVMNNCTASDITSTHNQNTGFLLSQVNNAYLTACQAQNIITNTASQGFSIDASTNIILYNCSAQDIIASINNANGFVTQTSSNITFQNCNATNIESLGSTANAFQTFSDCSTIIFDHCSAINCSALQGTGFSISNTGVTLTECLATTCSGLAGYLIQTGTASLQYCQAIFNTADGFLYQGGASLTGNCSAYNNTGVGFNVTGGSHIGYHNASFSNIINQFIGFGAINSIFDRVDPSLLVPNGPYAGANLTL